MGFQYDIANDQRKIELSLLENITNPIMHQPIDQFRYFKLQPNTIGITKRLWGINPTNSIGYSPEPRAEVYCFWLNFKISKLVFPAMPIPRATAGPGVCLCCQFRGWEIHNFISAWGCGICVPRGDRWACWHVFSKKSSDSKVFVLKNGGVHRTRLQLHFCCLNSNQARKWDQLVATKHNSLMVLERFSIECRK